MASEALPVLRLVVTMAVSFGDAVAGIWSGQRSKTACLRME